MRALVVVFAIVLLATAVDPVLAQKSDEPTATTSGSTPTSSNALQNWVPIPLTYYLHNTGTCDPGGDPYYHLTQNDTAGDVECPETLGVPEVSVPDPECPFCGFALPESEGSFTFPAAKPVPVLIPNGTTATFVLHFEITRKGVIFDFDGNWYEIPFKVTVGKAVCQGIARTEWRWDSDWLSPVKTVKGGCTFMNDAKTTEKATLDFTVRTGSAPIKIRMEGDYISQLAIGVLLNPLPVPTLTAAPLQPRGESSLVTVPLVLAVAVAAVVLLRRRE